MSLFQKGLVILRRLMARPLDPPSPPLAGVREPRRPRPTGHASSVAVLEPDEPQSIDAITRGRQP